MFYFDPIYFWWIFIPTLLISLGVQLYLKSTFNKWKQIRNHVNMNGAQVAQQLFTKTSLKSIKVEATPGEMTDHFDPGKNVVRLSNTVANQPTVASMAITAHELGHVQQYQTGSGLIKMRNFLLPALRFSPIVSYFAIFFGFYLNLVGLIWVGIIFFGIMVLFSIFTLPVEFDASRRGIKLLDEAGLLENPQDEKGAKQMLKAAGMTYLAAAVTSVLQLMYYISLANRRR